jgi:hypothetical protein
MSLKYLSIFIYLYSFILHLKYFRYPLGKINIVIMARLTYRKGIDLLVDIVP